MNFKQFSALRILNGKFGFLLRKCLFSVTSASAPTHSVYAAINASASFKPFSSYFTPNSNGIKKSSSIVVKRLINRIKIWNSLGNKFDLTSSTIVRHILIEFDEKLSVRNSRIDSQLFFLMNPKPKIYSLASSTSRKFILPKLFSNLPHMFDGFFFTHSGKRRRSSGYAFTKFMQEFFCFSFFILHRSSPHCVSFAIKTFNHTPVLLSNKPFCNNSKEYLI